jgi:hypothetical protein
MSLITPSLDDLPPGNAGNLAHRPTDESKLFKTSTPEKILVAQSDC